MAKQSKSLPVEPAALSKSRIGLAIPPQKGRAISARQYEWMLKLYVAGQTPRSLAAIDNLNRICEQHLQGRYHIEIIDLQQQPHLAREDQIVAIPTLVRQLPKPMRKIIGDLSNTEKTLVGLQLSRASTPST